MRNSFARLAIFSAFFSLFFLFLSSNDPFGIDDAVDQQSRDVIYRAFASTYGMGRTRVSEFGPDHKLWQPPISASMREENANASTIEAANEGASNTEDSETDGSSLGSTPVTLLSSIVGQTVPDETFAVELPETISQDEIVTVYLSDIVLNQLREQYRPKSQANETEDSANEDIEAGWQAWRPSYQDHTEMIYTLSTLWEQTLVKSDYPPAKKPPAIFFDFIFLEVGATGTERDYFDMFISEIAYATQSDSWDKNLEPSRCTDPYMKLVCIKAADGIPLIFARGENLALLDPTGAQEPAQQRLNEVAILAPVRFVNSPGDYPIETSSMSSAEQQNYLRASPTAKVQEFPAPATLLYLSWCMDEVNRCPWLEPDPENYAGITKTQRLLHMARTFAMRDYEPISLRWGVSVPEYFVDIERTMTGLRPGLKKAGALGDSSIIEPEVGSTITCRLENGGGITGVLTGISMTIRQALLNGRTSSTTALAQPCPYHLELPYLALASDINTENIVRSIFDGRLIVVGARFKNTNDLIRSPVHSLLPGMHGHAMATDNLINSHNRYLSSPQNAWFLFGSADMLDWVETLVMFVVLLMVAGGQWWLNVRLMREEADLPEQVEIGYRPSHWAAYTLISLSIFVFVVFFAWFQIVVLRMAPINWISISATAIGLFFFLLRDEIGDDMSRFLRRAPLINRIGNPILHTLAKYRRYMDMETIGFEKRTASLDEARKEKDRILSRLYPELEQDREAARDNTGRPPPL